MARTQWGIVYGTANPHVRRHILPDDDSELNDPRLVGPGEKLIKVPIVQSEDSPTFLARIDAAVCHDSRRRRGSIFRTEHLYQCFSRGVSWMHVQPASE